MLWLGLLILPAIAEGCGESVPKRPPCELPDYVTETCSIPGPNGTTISQEQCIRRIPDTLVQRWEFWFGLLLGLGLVAAGIITWRCIRYCQWYTDLKNNIRHEQNRTCARCCVKFICRCKACVKCCEPYTRATTSELERARDEANSHHHHSSHHHHHHLHLDRRRSECVHPESAATASKDQHSHYQSEHTQHGHHQSEHSHEPHHHVKHPDFTNKSLEDVCVEGIHIA